MQALHRAYFWCNMATNYNRIWKHHYAPVDVVPSFMILKATQITEAPKEPPLADAELDRLGEPAQPALLRADSSSSSSDPSESHGSDSDLPDSS